MGWSNQYARTSLSSTTKTRPGLRCGLFGYRDNTELLHHPESIELGPPFHDRPIHDALKRHAGNCYLLPCRWASLKFPLVGATPRPAGQYLVPLSNLVFNRKYKVGKGGTECSDELPHTFGALHCLGTSDVVNIPAREELLNDAKISSVPDLLNRTTGKRPYSRRFPWKLSLSCSLGWMDTLSTSVSLASSLPC